MNTKFTPGPLAVERWKHDESAYIVRDDRGEIIAKFHSHLARLSLEQAEANAKLFAAAPDLYEALQLCRSELEERFDLESNSTNPGIKVAASEARAALAKAAE